MRTRWRTLLLVLLALVPACGKDDAPSSSGEAKSTTTAAAGADGKLQLTLLEPGSAPRKAFRLAVKEGDERHSTMRMVMKLAQDMNGAASERSERTRSAARATGAGGAGIEPATSGSKVRRSAS